MIEINCKARMASVLRCGILGCFLALHSASKAQASPVIAEGFIEVTQNRNSICIVGKFDTFDDIPLFADGIEVHPLVFNHEKQLHYSTIWADEGCLFKNIEARDNGRVWSGGSWSTKSTVGRPKRGERLFVSPEGSGTDFSVESPGNLREALTSPLVAIGNVEIVLQDGIYEPLTPPPSAEAHFFASIEDTERISIVAAPGATPVISNARTLNSFASVGSSNPIWRADGLEQEILQVHVGLGESDASAQFERLQDQRKEGSSWERWEALSLISSKNGGWYSEKVGSEWNLFVKLPDGTRTPNSPDNPSNWVKVPKYPLAQAIRFSNCRDIWLENIEFECWTNNTSLLFQDCQDTIVRKCKNSISMGYAAVFDRCRDYLVEDCDFFDGETYASYRYMREATRVDDDGNLNGWRFSGCIQHHESELATLRRNRWEGCFIAFEMKGENRPVKCVDFIGNRIKQGRNHPVRLKGKEGEFVSIWGNVFDSCNQAMPNIEYPCEYTPVYWINNLAVNSGYIGTIEVGEDERKIANQGGRFGSSSSDAEYAMYRTPQHFFYYNTQKMDFPHHTHGLVFVWSSLDKNQSASRYYNNIFHGRNDRDYNAHIWHFGKGMLETEVNLARMKWDHNQYYWDSEDGDTDFPFGSGGTGYTFSLHRSWALGKGLNWELSGAFLDPDFDAEFQPQKPISAENIRLSDRCA